MHRHRCMEPLSWRHRHPVSGSVIPIVVEVDYTTRSAMLDPIHPTRRVVGPVGGGTGRIGDVAVMALRLNEPFEYRRRFVRR